LAHKRNGSRGWGIGRLQVQVIDAAGNRRVYRIIPWRVAALVLTVVLVLLGVSSAVGWLLAPKPDAEAAAHQTLLERENRDLRAAVAALEEETGVDSTTPSTPAVIPIPSLDAEPLVTVALKKIGPSITLEGEELRFNGAISDGALEVRWTQEGMKLVDGREVPDGSRFTAKGLVHIHGDSGYPGSLLLYHVGRRILPVCELPLERYLEGVVASELPQSWNVETKKAGAVAARSYALARMHEQQGVYAVESSVKDQVFRPGAVDNRSAEAVASTRGTVLTQDDGLVTAYYSSTCGGHTAVGAYVWPERGIHQDWSIPCDYCKTAPRRRWERTLTIEEMTASLSKKEPGLGIVTALTVLGRTPTGRVRNVRLSTESGSKVLTGDEFRHLMGTSVLFSHRFEVVPAEEGLTFEGSGYGHGVGMCQYGAQGMSEAGAEYMEILRYYYKGTTLQQVFK